MVEIYIERWWTEQNVFLHTQSAMKSRLEILPCEDKEECCQDFVTGQKDFFMWVTSGYQEERILYVLSTCSCWAYSSGVWSQSKLQSLSLLGEFSVKVSQRNASLSHQCSHNGWASYKTSASFGSTTSGWGQTFENASLCLYTLNFRT